MFGCWIAFREPACRSIVCPKSIRHEHTRIVIPRSALNKATVLRVGPNTAAKAMGHNVEAIPMACMTWSPCVDCCRPSRAHMNAASTKGLMSEETPSRMWCIPKNARGTTNKAMDGKRSITREASGFVRFAGGASCSSTRNQTLTSKS